MKRSCFPIKTANTLIIYRNDHIAFELPDLQDQKWLTLRGRSISECGREGAARSFPDNASRYTIYEWSQLIGTQITNHARPKIFDHPLTLILSRRRKVRRYLGKIGERHWWCGRNGVTERRRRWKTRRKRRDGGGII